MIGIDWRVCTPVLDMVLQEEVTVCAGQFMACIVRCRRKFVAGIVDVLITMVGVSIFLISRSSMPSASPYARSESPPPDVAPARQVLGTVIVLPFSSTSGHAPAPPPAGANAIAPERL